MRPGTELRLGGVTWLESKISLLRHPRRASVAMWQPARKDIYLMGGPRAPYMAKTDKGRLATGFWNRIESNQAADCNSKG